MTNAVTHEKLTMTYCVDWEGCKEKAWSGTKYGLRRGLERFYDINDYELVRTLPERGQRELSRRLGRDNVEVPSILRWNKNYDDVERDALITFNEVPNDPSIKNRYIYQDLPATFLLDCMHKNKQLLEWSGYGDASESALIQRTQWQDEFYETSNGIFTMSKWLRDYLADERGLPNDKVHYVGGGRNAAVLPSREAGHNRLLFVGRDFKRKGGDLVVEAFDLLKQRIPDVMLTIAGPSKEQFPHRDGITFLGDTDENTLSRLFASSDAFVMPSRFEAYGIVFPEALAAGIPCIGRNAFEMKHFIRNGENGLLVDSDSIEELANAMETVLDSEKIRETTAQEAPEAQRYYSWDAVAERMHDVIEYDLSASAVNPSEQPY